MTAAGDGTAALLAVTLEAAVPLRIMELRGASDETRLGLASEASDQIAAHGDNILFRGARRGDTARAVGWLITGLACAAYQPGGVRFRDLAWCAAHPRHRWAAGDRICALCLAAETDQADAGCCPGRMIPGTGLPSSARPTAAPGTPG